MGSNGKLVSGEQLNQREFKGYVTAKLEDFDIRIETLCDKFDKLDLKFNKDIISIKEKIDSLDRFDKKLALKVGGLGTVFGSLITLIVKAIFGR